MSMVLIDVESPSGLRFEHHAVRYPRPAVGTLVVVDESVLLLWRHRVITDTWGWEIPAGRVEAGEAIADAARRETLEETGWEPGPTEPMLSWHPANGTIDIRFHVERATSAEHRGDPTDGDESALVEWVALDDVRAMLRGHGDSPGLVAARAAGAGPDLVIGDGLTVVALLAELSGLYH